MAELGMNSAGSRQHTCGDAKHSWEPKKPSAGRVSLAEVIGSFICPNYCDGEQEVVSADTHNRSPPVRRTVPTQQQMFKDNVLGTHWAKQVGVQDFVGKNHALSTRLRACSHPHVTNEGTGSKVPQVTQHEAKGHDYTQVN